VTVLCVVPQALEILISQFEDYMAPHAIAMTAQLAHLFRQYAYEVRTIIIILIA
jgi:hypothetical protein